MRPSKWLVFIRPSLAGFDRPLTTAASRTFSRSEVEGYLESLLRRDSEAGINRLRDTAREVSKQLLLSEEFQALDKLIGSLLGTRDAKLETPTGQARKRGMPYDPDRLELFGSLFRELRSTAPPLRLAGSMSDAAKVNLAFFEAYFSNYIEGTKFPVEEAADIVFNGIIPKARPEDVHDILGTYRVVVDYSQMSRAPRDFAEFVSLMRSRHASIMELRTDKAPGALKTVPNSAGNTLFVKPDLVLGTLEKGFELYRGLESAFHRAVFMMFLVSEVHPFADGNGRVARIMMNAELVAGGEQKIIIPNVFRDDYLTSLKALSHTGRTDPFPRTLDFAQRYTAAIRWDEFDTARYELDATNGFLETNEADAKGLRLVLPKAANL